MFSYWVVPEKIDTSPMEEISAIPRGGGGEIVVFERVPKVPGIFNG